MQRQHRVGEFMVGAIYPATETSDRHLKARPQRGDFMTSTPMIKSQILDSAASPSLEDYKRAHEENVRETAAAWPR
jgi:hypothetical protein